MQQQRQRQAAWLEPSPTQSEQASEPVAFRLPTLVDYVVRVERTARDRMILENVKRTARLRASESVARARRKRMIETNRERTKDLRRRMAGKVRALCCPCGRRNGCQVAMRVISRERYEYQNAAWNW